MNNLNRFARLPIIDTTPPGKSKEFSYEDMMAVSATLPKEVGQFFEPVPIGGGQDEYRGNQHYYEILLNIGMAIWDGQHQDWPNGFDVAIRTDPFGVLIRECSDASESDFRTHDYPGTDYHTKQKNAHRVGPVGEDRAFYATYYALKTLGDWEYHYRNPSEHDMRGPEDDPK